MQTTELRLESTESTMDSAKTILDNQDFILVTCQNQTQGKGTRGRVWQAGPGNIFMTVGINRRHLSEKRLLLLPLEIGLHLWNAVALNIQPQFRSKLTLKWPNDLMYEGAKVAGILIETYGKFFLIGIGVNVATSPIITDGGNPSSSLMRAGLLPEENEALIQGLYQRIKLGAEPDSLLLDWQGKVDWEQRHRIRERADRPWVKPIMINKQGHLQIEHSDGSREWLVSEYLA